MILNKKLIYQDEKPDNLGRRFFFLEWEDTNKYIPNFPKDINNTHRAQAFFCNPEKYILDGFIPVI